VKKLANMREIKVFTKNQNEEELVGLKTYPEIRKEKYPTVLLLHGFGMTRDEYKDFFPEIARSINSIGCLVYRFDASGRGESEGDYSKTTLSKQVEELEKIIEFLNTEPNVDKNNIAIVAQSFGTSATIALHPKIKAIALMGSFHRLEKVFADHFGKDYNPNGVSIIKRSDDSDLAIGPQFWKDLRKYNILSDIKKTSASILFIHGDKDTICPLEEMEALFKVANEPKEKVIIKGNDHGQDPCRDKAYKVLNNWLDKVLEQKPRL
jgi:uncharacterized protein